MSQIDCEQVLEQIELYLDGELEGELQAEIEDHLHQCGPCMDHSDFQRRLKELLKNKCGCDEVPPDLLERVRGLLAETRQDPRS